MSYREFLMSRFTVRKERGYRPWQKKNFSLSDLPRSRRKKAAAASTKELETANGSITDLTDKLKDFDGVNDVNINNRSWRLQPFNKIHLKSKYLRIFCTYIGNKDLKKIFSANIQLFVSNYIDSCKSYKELTTALFFETPKTQNRFRKVQFIFINNMKNILNQQHSTEDARYI